MRCPGRGLCGLEAVSVDGNGGPVLRGQRGRGNCQRGEHNQSTIHDLSPRILDGRSLSASALTDSGQASVRVVDRPHPR